MNCLLCGTTYHEISWYALVTGKQPSTCKDCHLKFNYIESTPSRTYFQGTPLEDCLDSVTCLYEYNEWMKDYFHKYKRLGDHALSRVFSHHFTRGPYTPIPIYHATSPSKTFPHVEAFLPKKSTQHLLMKVDATNQSQRTLSERLVSSNPFRWISTEPPPKEIYLVDDIYTTGTTLHQAAYIAKQNGVQIVRGLCLAETFLKKE